jgi:DNA-binding IclR family transcriptional regulator
MRLMTLVGSQAIGSASGRVMLASMPPSTLAAVFGGHLLVSRPAGA